MAGAFEPWGGSFPPFGEVARVPVPEPIAYLVLDHDVAAGAHVEGRDVRGRRWVRVSPSVMDAAKHVKFGGLDMVEARLLDGILSVPLGIQVYRREDLPDGWPG